MVLAMLLPGQLLAADSASAMLYSNGTAWVNGSTVPKSAAVFAGDMVQTRRDSTANLSANGTSVMVLADSIVKFQGPAVEIEHGAVRVSTAQGLATHAGEVTVKPAGNSWTEFQVTDVDGQVKIVATKGDVTVQDQQGTTTVQQGQQTTRDDTSNPEKKKKKKRSGAGAATAAGGGILSSSTAIYTGIAIVGGITTWVLLQNDEPLSPACPNNTCP
jgi:ferric-dicitrate binding protein FerR (iron transport regulator)